jgi:hypothetical protein
MIVAFRCVAPIRRPAKGASAGAGTQRVSSTSRCGHSAKPATAAGCGTTARTRGTGCSCRRRHRLETWPPRAAAMPPAAVPAALGYGRRGWPRGWAIAGTMTGATHLAGLGRRLARDAWPSRSVGLSQPWSAVAFTAPGSRTRGCPGPAGGSTIPSVGIATMWVLERPRCVRCGTTGTRPRRCVTRGQTRRGAPTSPRPAGRPGSSAREHRVVGRGRLMRSGCAEKRQR